MWQKVFKTQKQNVIHKQKPGFKLIVFFVCLFFYLPQMHSSAATFHGNMLYFFFLSLVYIVKGLRDIYINQSSKVQECQVGEQRIVWYKDVHHMV